MALKRDVGAILGTYQVGSHFEALNEGVLLVPYDPKYTKVGFNLVSVQVCVDLTSRLHQVIVSHITGWQSALTC